MTMNQFLIAFASNFLSLTLPLCVGIYFAIRLALTHGIISYNLKKGNKEIGELRRELRSQVSE